MFVVRMYYLRWSNFDMVPAFAFGNLLDAATAYSIHLTKLFVSLSLGPELRHKLRICKDLFHLDHLRLSEFGLEAHANFLGTLVVLCRVIQ